MRTSVLIRLSTILFVTASLLSCASSRQQPLPRLTRYDFLGQTQADLAGLRHIAPSDSEEGPMARYALARAHADWLILALIRDRDDDQLLRLLAVDLGVEGASPDDRLSLPQIIATIDAILEEVEAGGGAGAESRRWAGEITRLLETIREGWEEFSPELISSVSEVSTEPGPTRNAADLLALGWGRLALWASQQQPPAERAVLLARMAGYYDPEIVEALHEGEVSLLEAGVEVACPVINGDVLEGDPLEMLAQVRASCDATPFGLPREVAGMLSPELAVTARVLQDLLARRERLRAETEDPLVVAAAQDLAHFDELLPALSFPLPLPVPGPNLPTPPSVEGPGTWRPTGAVVTLVENRPHIAIWPTLAVRDGQLRLIDRVEGFALPGRPAPANMAMALGRTWQTSAEHLGNDERSVALLVPDNLGIRGLITILEACQRAEAERIDLIVTTSGAGMASIPLGAERGAAAARASDDRRAMLVLSSDGIQMGTAEGHWVEFQDVAEGLPTIRISPLLGHHIAGHGLPSCIVSVRPDLDVGRVADLVDLLARAPRSREGTSEGWDILLDPEDPPAPTPVASTAADAVALHRVSLRSCYERYMRAGGRAQGRLVLEISVTPEGEVTDARVVDSELGPQTNLDNCLVSEGLSMRFPANMATPTIRIPLRLVPR